MNKKKQHKKLENMRENINNLLCFTKAKWYSLLKDKGIIENIVNRLSEKDKKYGDSWMSVPLDKLRERVDTIYNSYKSRIGILDLEQKTVLDLINQSILLLLRLKAQKNFLSSYDFIDLSNLRKYLELMNSEEGD